MLLSLFHTSAVQSDEVPQFEEKLINFFHRDVQLLSSYRMALYLTLKNLELPNGSEVLVSPITIPDAINAIILNGLIPKFVELDLNDHNIELSKLKNDITNKSKVLISTTLSGLGSKQEILKKICHENNLFFIEDFSQSVGSYEDGKLLGTFGDVAIASLSRGKTITAMAGAILISDNKQLLESLRNTTKNYTFPSKNLFSYYCIYNLFLNFATQKYIFSFIVYPIIRLISSFKRDFSQNISTEIQNQRDIFYDNIPIRRDSFPLTFFTRFCNWQAQMATPMLNNLQKNNQKRRIIGETILNNLTPEALSLIPKSFRLPANNTYYHLPLNLPTQHSSEIKTALFNNGIDNTGFGLNLCSEENVFKKFSRNSLKHAKYIKEHVTFIPVHESFHQNDAIIIAKKINHVIQEYI